MTSLARQLAEHPRWEWHGGMHYRFNGRRYLYTGCSSIGGMDAGCAPDLDDPATLGWGMRMLWDIDPKAHTYQNAGRWYVTFHDVEGDSPGEVVFRALLAAWGES